MTTLTPIPPSTPFIGREQILADIEQQFKRDDVRLMTLTGTGGVGKTLLALHLIERLREYFPDGVYYVSLAPITDFKLVIPTIAHELGIYQTQQIVPYDQLTAFFSGQQLLVLDNFEHVISAATTLGDLLLKCRDLKIIVTSRTRLRLSREHEFSIPPLALPEQNQSLDLSTLEEYDAVSLFIKRVQAIKPDFRLNVDNAQTIAQICQQLDGLPLALELAAARIKLLPPKAMLTRMNNRLQLLTNGAVDLPLRHQSLRATLDWSYNLLDAPEQRLFRYFSVFSGGCTLDAIESIAHMPDEQVQEVFNTIALLIDKCLLYQDQRDEDNPRILMLESTREYAFEQLRNNGEENFVRHYHAQHYLQLAETAYQYLNTVQQKLWLDRLEQEHNNFRTVLQWVINSHDNEIIEIGLRLAAALCNYWAYRGYLQEGRDWLEYLLSIAKEFPMISAYIKALTNAGLFAIRYSDFERAKLLLETALNGWREQGDVGRWGTALTLDSLGWTASAFGDFARARDLYQASIRLHRELGTLHTSEAADALAHLSMSEFFDSGSEDARMLAQESLEIKRKVGDRWGTGFALYLLACCAIVGRRHVEVRSYIQEGYKICFELNEFLLRIFFLETQAWAFATFGDDEAVRHSVQVWHFAQILRSKQGQPQPPQWAIMLGNILADVRNRLGENVFSDTWEQGRKLTLEQAIALCFDESKPVLISPNILSIRELEVIRLLATGLSDAQIAEKLVLSVRTVNAHLQSIYNKLGVNSRTSAIHEAAKLRLFT